MILERGKAVVGTVSGTNISFGTTAKFKNTTSEYISAAYDSANNKVVVSYSDEGNKSRVKSTVGTVSGTNISFGVHTRFSTTDNSDSVISVYDSFNNKIVIAYRDTDSNNAISAVVGTVSGTSISFGSPVTFASWTGVPRSASYDSTNNKVVIFYSSSDDGMVITGTVFGDSISFGTPSMFEATSVSRISSTYSSSDNKAVVMFNTLSYFVKLLSTSNLEGYIGLAAEAIADGAIGKVTISNGVNAQQSGLTPGNNYYLQSTGSIGLSSGSSSVIAGKSVSSTEIIVK